MKKVWVKVREPIPCDTQISFWEQFEMVKKPNYSEDEVLFELEIKGRKVR